MLASQSRSQKIAARLSVPSERSQSRFFRSVSWKPAVIWHLDRLIPLRAFVRPEGYMVDALLASSGDELLTVDVQSKLVAWNAHTGELRREAALGLPAGTQGSSPFATRHSRPMAGYCSRRMTTANHLKSGIVALRRERR